LRSFGALIIGLTTPPLGLRTTQPGARRKCARRGVSCSRKGLGLA
jgi:hypothetical protein